MFAKPEVYQPCKIYTRAVDAFYHHHTILLTKYRVVCKAEVGTIHSKVDAEMIFF